MDLTVKQVKCQHSAIQTQKTKRKVRRNYCYILTRNSLVSTPIQFTLKESKDDFNYSSQNLLKHKIVDQGTASRRIHTS